MLPSTAAVLSRVIARFTLDAGLDRARRQRKGAAPLSLLHSIAPGDGVGLTEIADLQVVHPSLIRHFGNERGLTLATASTTRHEEPSTSHRSGVCGHCSASASR